LLDLEFISSRVIVLIAIDRMSDLPQLGLTISSLGGQGANCRKACRNAPGEAWDRNQRRSPSNLQLSGKIASNFNYVWVSGFVL